MKSCLFCHRTFPENQTLEHFPAGRRVAYDPWRGRLWAVCPSCARWTLAPLDSRWETLESLERLTRGGARLLGQTENVALLAAEDLEIVRVGRAELREESWWRYGREFSARRQRAGRTARRGKVFDALTFLLMSGIPFWGLSDAAHWIARARRKEFGPIAWSGLSYCPGCGGALDRIGFDEAEHVVILPGGAEGLKLWYGCPWCRDRQETGHALTGLGAEHLLRRFLAHANFAGGTEGGVRAAMDLVEAHPEPERLLGRVAGSRTAVAQLTLRGSLALEIALNQDVERRLLEMELDELEARWRDEEEIAAIADDLL